jgi:hypothetical protein
VPGAAEFDLRPFQVGDLAGAQAVPVGDEDQRTVAMAVAAAAGRADELFDLGPRQILAGAKRGVGSLLWEEVDIINDGNRLERPQ